MRLEQLSELINIVGVKRMDEDGRIITSISDQEITRSEFLQGYHRARNELAAIEEVVKSMETFWNKEVDTETV